MSADTPVRRTTWVLAGTVALTWAAVGVVALGRPDPPPPVAVPAATRVPLLPPASSGPLPSAAGVQRALAAGLTDPALGGAVAVSVVDALSGRVLFERGAARAVTPASTAKLATAVAALTALPSSFRFTTRVVAGATPGEVVLVGGGDASLAGPLTGKGYPRMARLADLATQVRATGLPVTRVLVDDSRYSGPLLGPGWRPEYVTGGDVAPVTALMVDGGRTAPPGSRRPRVADPALAAGRSLAALLGAPAAPVLRGRAGPTASALGSVASPPVSELVEVMLSRSDNDLAEALARAVAVERGLPASFAGAERALAGVLGEPGLPGPAVALRDGSGLSRLARATPAALTQLLSTAVVRDGLAPVLSGLPVAGFDGTLDDRYRGGPAAAAAGVVRAKTGTLNGVGALAGLVRTRSGALLAFALAADGVPFGRTLATQAALDRLAASLSSCGCP